MLPIISSDRSGQAQEVFEGTYISREMFAEHCSTTSSLSSDGETETQDVETEEEDIMMEPPIRLKRDFGVAPLDRYPSTDCLLNELLGDIRRSRTTSLASTPTNISSDYETENVFDVKNRSEAELWKLGELLSVLATK